MHDAKASSLTNRAKTLHLLTSFRSCTQRQGPWKPQKRNKREFERQKAANKLIMKLLRGGVAGSYYGMVVSSSSCSWTTVLAAATGIVLRVALYSHFYFLDASAPSRDCSRGIVPFYIFINFAASNLRTFPRIVVIIKWEKFIIKCIFKNSTEI